MEIPGCDEPASLRRSANPGTFAFWYTKPIRGDRVDDWDEWLNGRLRGADMVDVRGAAGGNQQGGGPGEQEFHG